jgi:hypothetical protein
LLIEKTIGQNGEIITPKVILSKNNASFMKPNDLIAKLMDATVKDPIMQIFILVLLDPGRKATNNLATVIDPQNREGYTTALYFVLIY